MAADPIVADQARMTNVTSSVSMKIMIVENGRQDK